MVSSWVPQAWMACLSVPTCETLALLSLPALFDCFPLFSRLRSDEQQAADFVGALRAVAADDGASAGEQSPTASPPAAPSDSVGRRLRQAGAAGAQGQLAVGEARFAGSVVGCRGGDCRGYRVQARGRVQCHACWSLLGRLPEVNGCACAGRHPAFKSSKAPGLALSMPPHLSCRAPALAAPRLRPSLPPRLRRWSGGLLAVFVGKKAP